MKITEEMRIQRAHVKLMKHPETALYAGIMLWGTSTVCDTTPTAYTDGCNKVYGREFVKKLNDKELRGLIMHENLHVALQHIPRFEDKFKENAQLANATCDYVTNDIIDNFKDKQHCLLPEGALLDSKYHGWSANEVFRDQKQKQDEDPDYQPEDSMDEHGFGEGESADMTPEKAEQMSQEIDQKLREGAILAGKLGGSTPKQIRELLDGVVDWKDVLREFLSSHMRGGDEYTFRKYNKRRIMDELYLPDTFSESLDEVCIAWDTSGSIDDEANGAFAGEMKSICELMNPEKVRILWWDTEVAGEQVFTKGNYDTMDKMLKPMGGGGTDPNCVPKYLKDKNINASAMIVFTDGYFWDKIEWSTDIPTLWLVTENDKLEVPKGKIIKQIL
jgi:predicted metal-dependent peptidase